ncbi:MAG: ribosome-associated translation inhibitor RaiA [Gammaproteobacteria bacterium]|nr:ribosome-associated translation inhibitor RaiA [Gammaproteobacteria bacterium]
MQIEISGQHMQLTEPLQEYVQQKIQRLERHFEHISHIHVVLSPEKLLHKAEATVGLTGTTLFAESCQEDMYASIDLMIDKVDGQLRKHKGKITDHHRAGGALKDQTLEEPEP